MVSGFPSFYCKEFDNRRLSKEFLVYCRMALRASSSVSILADGFVYRGRSKAFAFYPRKRTSGAHSEFDDRTMQI